MMDNLLFKSGNSGPVNIDQAQGIVECFVAGIGNKDSVGDVVISGAFAKSLMRRKPRVVWGHSWNDPIGKVLEMYEVPVGDSRLPAKMRNAGIGGLYAKVQFNLNSEKGKEAFATVAFFGEEQEWSIGYKTIDSVFDPKLQANILKEVELYEVSPVLHGANQLTGTISIKGDEKGHMPIIPMPGMGMPMMQDTPRIVVIAAPQEGVDESSEGDPFAEGMSRELSQPDKMALQAELTERTGSKIEVMNATENSVVFRRTTSDGQASMYRLPYHREGDQYMFGKPEPYTASNPTPQPMQNIEQKPGAPVVVPNGGIAYRSDDQAELATMFANDNAVQSPWGKSDVSHLIELPESYMASAKDFITPVLRHHKLAARPNAKGIVIDGVLTATALDALQNAVKALGATLGQTSGNIGQAIGKIRDLAQTFNPYALDGDGDGFVQDGSAFQRPYIPVKKPGFDLPDVRGRKRSGDALLDKPRSAPKLPKDKNTWTRAQRNEALLAGIMEPETREDIAFLANRRPENEGIAKYWDMSEADLTKEGNRLVNARRQAAGAEKEKIDEELLKVSHEFQRRASYAETFGQEFVPPAKREAPEAMVPEADKPKPAKPGRTEAEGLASAGKVFDALNTDDLTDGKGYREWDDLSDNEKFDMFEEVQYDYLYDRFSDRGDDGLVDLMESGNYDDEILEHAEEVYNKIKAKREEEGDRAADAAMDRAREEDGFASRGEDEPDAEELAQREADRALDEQADAALDRALEGFIEKYGEDEFDKLTSDEQDAILEQGRDQVRGLASTGEKGQGEFGSNPQDSAAAKAFDSILEKYWKMWGFDVPDKDDKGYDEPFGFASRGNDEEVKQSKLDELVGGVKDRLLAELETADPATWKPSWRNDSLPINPITGKPYKGWNAFFLMLAAHDRKYNTGRFAGFNQLKERGAQVRKGEKGIPILRPQLVKKEDEDGNVKEFVVFRGATVFNIDQTDGGDESLRAIPADLPESERIAILDDTLKELGVNVRTDNMTPHYNPEGDYISMPDFAKGTSALEWTSTLAHEAVHWTGHKSRMDRASLKDYSSDKKVRAYEELVAEIGSAMLLAAHGIEAPFRQDHAPYIKGWIQLLKDDPDALGRAFKDAQAAVNFMLEKSPNLRKLFGGVDTGKKAPEVDAPDKAEALVAASDGFASLHRVRTPGSEVLSGILYDDNSKDLMVGFMKGKSWNDLSDEERENWIEKYVDSQRDVGGYRRPLSDSELDDRARDLYDDSREIGWYVYSDVSMEEVSELAAARSKGRHINALKRMKKARKASDEDKFNFFGRSERVQDVSRAKMTDGLASGGNENISISKNQSGYWVMSAMVTGQRGASEEDRGTFRLQLTVSGGSRRDALKRFRENMRDRNVSFSDGFAAGAKKLGVEPRYQDKDWIDKTQQRILKSGLDFQSLSESERIDWANSFLNEYLNENDMGHGLADVANGRRLNTRPDIELLNYAEEAYARMSDAHMARRAQFGYEDDGLASVGQRTRKLGIKPSNAVDYVSYDPDSERLFVAYKREDGRGDMYVYEGVSMDDAIGLENAPSVGKAINDIKRRKNVRKATPEEIVGLSESDRKEGNSLKRAKAINTIDAIYANDEHRTNRDMQLEINADRVSVEDDGTTTWESADDTMRYTISPTDDGGYLVTAEKLSRGGREEPDTFETVFSSRENNREGAITALFNAAKTKIADDDGERRIERELEDARRELDMAGDMPGVESVDVTYSSALDAVDYNPSTQELRVSYKDGGTYVYEGVDRTTFEEFKSAPSKGRAMNEIKRAHPYRKDSEWTGGKDEDGGIEEFDVRGSAAVEKVTYDPSKEELTVVYAGGKGYIYSGVTREEADAVRSAPSKGRAINDVKRTHDVRRTPIKIKETPDPEKNGWTKGEDGKWSKGDFSIEILSDDEGNYAGLLATDRTTGDKYEQAFGGGTPAGHLDEFERILRIMGDGKLDDDGKAISIDPAPTPKPRMATKKPPRGGKRVRNRSVVIEMEQGTLDEIIEAEGKNTTVDALRDAAGSPMGKYTKGPRKGKNRGYDTITVRDAETGELLHANEILLTSSASPGSPSAANRKRGYIRARSYAGRQGHHVMKDEGPSLRGEGRGMTEYDKRVYGLGSDEKNREAGLASRGSDLKRNLQARLDDMISRQEALDTSTPEGRREWEKLEESIGILDDRILGMGEGQVARDDDGFASGRYRQYESGWDSVAETAEVTGRPESSTPRWEDLDYDQQNEFIHEVDYDYMYDNHGELGDDGIVEAMEDGRYDDAISEHAEMVWDTIADRKENQRLVRALEGTDADPEERASIAEYWSNSDALHDRYMKQANGNLGEAMNRAYEDYLSSLADMQDDGFALTSDDYELIERGKQTRAILDAPVVRGEKSPLLEMSPYALFDSYYGGGSKFISRSEDTYDIYGAVRMPISQPDEVFHTNFADQIVKDFSRSDLTVDELAERFDLTPLQVQDVLDDANMSIRRLEQLRNKKLKTTSDDYEIRRLAPVEKLFTGDRKHTDIPEPSESVIAAREPREAISRRYQQAVEAQKRHAAAMKELEISDEYREARQIYSTTAERNRGHLMNVTVDESIKDDLTRLSGTEEEINIGLLRDGESFDGADIYEILSDSGIQFSDPYDYYDQDEDGNLYSDGESVEIENLDLDWFDVDFDALDEDERKQLSDAVQSVRDGYTARAERARQDLGLPRDADKKAVKKAIDAQNDALKKPLDDMRKEVNDKFPYENIALVPRQPAKSSLTGIRDENGSLIRYDNLATEYKKGVNARIAKEQADKDGLASRSDRPLTTEYEWTNFEDLDARSQDRIIRDHIANIDRVAQPEIDLEAEREFAIQQWDDDAHDARAQAAESLLAEINELWDQDADADNPFQRNGNLAYAEELVKNTSYVEDMDLAEARNIVDEVRERFEERKRNSVAEELLDDEGDDEGDDDGFASGRGPRRPSGDDDGFGSARDPRDDEELFYDDERRQRRGSRRFASNSEYGEDNEEAANMRRRDDGFASAGSNLSDEDKKEIIAVAEAMGNRYTNSVVAQYNRDGDLSDAQWDALDRMTKRFDKESGDYVRNTRLVERRNAQRSRGRGGLASRSRRDMTEQEQDMYDDAMDSAAQEQILREEYARDMANMEAQELQDNFARLNADDQNMYFQRALANNAESGMSTEQILEEAKKLAMDDRRLAEFERQSIGMGQSSKPRKIDVSSSSALNSVEYDEMNRRLAVEYRGRDGKGTGTLYTYEGVEPEMVDRIEASDSRGATMREIRDNYEFSTSRKLPDSAYEGLASRSANDYQFSPDDMQKILSRMRGTPEFQDLNEIQEILDGYVARGRTRRSMPDLDKREMAANRAFTARRAQVIEEMIAEGEIIPTDGLASRGGRKSTEQYQSMLDELPNLTAPSERPGRWYAPYRYSPSNPEGVRNSTKDRYELIHARRRIAKEMADANGVKFNRKTTIYDVSQDEDDHAILEELDRRIEAFNELQTARDQEFLMHRQFEQVAIGKQSEAKDVIRYAESAIDDLDSFDKMDEDQKAFYGFGDVKDSATDLLSQMESSFGGDSFFEGSPRSSGGGGMHPSSKEIDQKIKQARKLLESDDPEDTRSALGLIKEIAQDYSDKFSADYYEAEAKQGELIDNGYRPVSVDDIEDYDLDDWDEWQEVDEDTGSNLDYIEDSLFGPMQEELEMSSRSQRRATEADGLAAGRRRPGRRNQGSRGQGMAPTTRYTDEDRQNIADRNILRSRKRPAKRRQGPDESEWDGFASADVDEELDMPSDVAVDSRGIFEGGEHGPGKDMSLRVMWNNIRRSGENNEWLSDSMTAEELADQLRVSRTVAQGLLDARPRSGGAEKFIDDPYLADQISRNIGMTATQLFGFDPLQYYDESGTPALTEEAIDAAIASERARRAARVAAREGRRTGKATLYRNENGDVNVRALEEKLNVKLTDDEGNLLSPTALNKATQDTGLGWGLEKWRRIYSRGGALTPLDVEQLVNRGILDAGAMPKREDLTFEEVFQWPGFADLGSQRIIDALSETLGLDRAEIMKQRRSIQQALTSARRGERRALSTRNLQQAKLKLSRAKVRELAERLGLDAGEFERWFGGE